MAMRFWICQSKTHKYFFDLCEPDRPSSKAFGRFHNRQDSRRVMTHVHDVPTINQSQWPPLHERSKLRQKLENSIKVAMQCRITCSILISLAVTQQPLQRAKWCETICLKSIIRSSLNCRYQGRYIPRCTDRDPGSTNAHGRRPLFQP